jgi:hypothetical protein
MEQANAAAEGTAATANPATILRTERFFMTTPSDGADKSNRYCSIGESLGNTHA